MSGNDSSRRGVNSPIPVRSPTSGVVSTATVKPISERRYRPGRHQTLHYDGADRNSSIVNGATTVTYTRDALNRITQHVAVTSGVTSTTRHGCCDGSDSPRATLDGAGTGLERVTGLAGGVNVTRRTLPATTVMSKTFEGTVDEMANGYNATVTSSTTTAHSGTGGLRQLCLASVSIRLFTAIGYETEPYRRALVITWQHRPDLERQRRKRGSASALPCDGYGRCA